MEKRIPLIIVISILVITTLVVFSFISFQRLIHTARLLSHTSRVINNAEQVIKSMIDIETGHRGYVITEDEAFLIPSIASSKNINQHLYSLDSLTKNDSAQHRRVEQLHLLVNQSLNWSQQMISTRKESFESARDLVLTGEGKKITNTARILIDEIQAEARANFNIQNSVTSASLKIFQYLFLGLVVTILALVIYLTYVIFAALRGRTNIERQLKKNAEEIQELYDKAPCGYLSVDHTITLSNINETLLDWLGYTKVEVLGKMKYEDLLSPKSREDFLNSFNTDFNNYLETGYVNDLEFEFLRKDGSIFPVIVNSIAKFNEHGEFVSSRTSVFDDTKRKKTEKKFSTILESSPDGLIIVDKNGFIQVVNRQTENLFGYNRSELLGQPISMLIPLNHRDGHHKHMQGYFNNPLARPMGMGLELFGLKKDGAKLPVEISLSPIDYPGDPLVAAAIRDITKRKQSEELLREREERFRSIVSSVYDAIIILDENGRVLNWNKGAENIFGWSEEEMLGKSLTQTMPEKYRSQHTADLKRYKESRQSNLIGKSIELEGLRKDGKVFPLELSLGKWHKGDNVFYCGIVRDMSERKRAEKMMSEMVALVAFSEDAIISLTADGNIYSWNKGAESLYGYTFEEVRDKHINIIVPEELIANEKELINKVLDGNSLAHYETVRQCKDGTMLNISLSISPIKDKSNKIIGISKIARDITEEIKRKEEILQLNTELDAFTYSVSHDLRAPLRSISGYSQILLEDYHDKLDEEGLRVTNVIIKNANRMGVLIDDLLNFSRLGRKELNMSIVNMKDMVVNLIEEVIPQDKKIRIEIGEIASAPADSSMIAQVWTNLIANAIKYSSKNDSPKIEIGSYLEDQHVCFYVRDNGVGFDMKYYDKLFGVFQRLHKMNEFEGTGVGLALVKKIVERHRGHVWAEAEVNKGASFYFSLPKDINS
jgi:PAS domain S-box-containing protein